MRKLALAAILLVTSAISPAMASNTCLMTHRIDNTKVVDAKTILFRMKDGKVWRNTLQTPCPGLLFEGFVYVAHNDQICGNEQSIRVLRSHEVCMLGPFAPDHTQRG